MAAVVLVNHAGRCWGFREAQVASVPSALVCAVILVNQSSRMSKIMLGVDACLLEKFPTRPAAV